MYHVTSVYHPNDAKRTFIEIVLFLCKDHYHLTYANDDHNNDNNPNYVRRE